MMMNPFYNPVFTEMPSYNPNMTQNQFMNYRYPQNPPAFTPRVLIIPNQFIPQTPRPNLIPPSYNPINTEPNFANPLPNNFIQRSPRKRPNNLNFLDTPTFSQRSKQANNSIYKPFTINFSMILGEGFYSTVYLGTYIPNNIEVSVKIQKNSSFPYVFNEIQIYNRINGLNGIPKIYWTGKYNNKDTIVFQKLGKSLQKDFYDNNKQYDIWKIKQIGIEALNIIESIHGKNIVHGDIKPSCFYYGNNNSNNLYLANFGFAFEFCNGFTGNHIPFKVNVRSFEDMKFCSKNHCRTYQKSRRDDIESLGYVLVYFINGSLPWESFNNTLDISKSKLSTSLDDLCYGLPSNISEFIKYSWNLKFQEKPDYNYLRKLINNYPKLIPPILPINLLNVSFTKKSLNDSDKSSNSILVVENDNFNQIDNKEFDRISHKTNSFVVKEDLNIIERLYVKNKNSQIFNNKLRMFGPMALDEEEIKLYNALMEAINSNRTEQNYLVHRFVKNDYLESVFNFKPTFNIYYNLMMIQQQIGSRKIEKGFMSCYMTDKHIIERNIKLEIKIPKGTRAYITRNKDESEIILPCNTEYEITGANIINISIIQIYVNIINYDENNTDLFSNLLRK